VNLEFGTIRSAVAGGSLTPQRRAPSHAKLRARLHASLLVLDTLCIFFGFFIASLVYPPGSGPEQWLLAASMLTPVYIGAALNSRAYAAEVIPEPSRGVVRSIQAFIVAAGTVVLIAFFLKTSESYSRVTLGIGTGISVLFLAVARDVFLRQARKIVGGNPYTVVLISDGSQMIDPANFSMVIATDDVLDPTEDSPAMYDRLATVLQDVDRVVIACSVEHRLGWVRVLKGLGIQSEILAHELTQLAPLGMGSWAGAPTIVVAEGPLSKVDSFLKRGFDLVLTTILLLILAPALIVTAMAIKLESRGPIFFVQTRIGLGNRLFRMLKFRSMRHEARDQNANVLTQRDDDRITKIGKFIRKTSVDELPQLINVLRGEMSIVGPRPHAIGARAADKLYWEVDERYWHRHAAKPGLTGLAQIRGYRGATTHESDLTDRLQADLEYLNDWSIWRDIKILLMTFRVLIHKNAY